MIKRVSFQPHNYRSINTLKIKQTEQNISSLIFKNGDNVIPQKEFNAIMKAIDFLFSKNNKNVAIRDK